jgi:hypothetical protein
MQQKHLNNQDQTNQGSYYTDLKFIEIAYDFIENETDLNGFTILDNSCGYGSFFKDRRIDKNRKVAVDIDEIALKQVKNVDLKINLNSLMETSRKNYKIEKNEKLIIIGNPPYNDTTSQVKQNIKNNNFDILKKYKTRDLGISFLRSYVDLNPDYVCILHPLSYLIKKTNFNLLKKFKDNYKLIDSLIISSKHFTNSKTEFPIIIALYKKGMMDFNFIENYNFKTDDGSIFKIANFDFINNYIRKYPNKKPQEFKAMFYTMRDINALKRSKTFLEKPNTNTIYVQEKDYKYYKYVDVFKKYADRLPYYFGNLDIFIGNDKFLAMSDEFLDYENNKNSIDDYFKELFNFNKSYDKISEFKKENSHINSFKYENNQEKNQKTLDTFIKPSFGK